MARADRRMRRPPRWLRGGECRAAPVITCRLMWRAGSLLTCDSPLALVIRPSISFPIYVAESAPSGPGRAPIGAFPQVFATSDENPPLVPPDRATIRQFTCQLTPVLREVHRERGMRVCFFVEEPAGRDLPGDLMARREITEAGQQRLDRYKRRRDEYIREAGPPGTARFRRSRRPDSPTCSPPRWRSAGAGRRPEPLGVSVITPS